MHRLNRTDRTACNRRRSNSATVAPVASWRNSSKYLGLGYGRLSLASGVAAVLRLEWRRHTAISVKSIRPRKRLKAPTEREVIGIAARVHRRAHAGA
jgi:hypothetical protein